MPRTGTQKIGSCSNKIRFGLKGVIMTTVKSSNLAIVRTYIPKDAESEWFKVIFIPIIPNKDHLVILYNAEVIRESHMEIALQKVLLHFDGEIVYRSVYFGSTKQFNVEITTTVLNPRSTTKNFFDRLVDVITLGKSLKIVIPQGTKSFALWTMDEQDTSFAYKVRAYLLGQNIDSDDADFVVNLAAKNCDIEQTTFEVHIAKTPPTEGWYLANKIQHKASLSVYTLFDNSLWVWLKK